MSASLFSSNYVCLRCTLSPFLQSQRRAVSRTSAINRGLRASKQGDGAAAAGSFGGGGYSRSDGIPLGFGIKEFRGSRTKAGSRGERRGGYHLLDSTRGGRRSNEKRKEQKPREGRDRQFAEGKDPWRLKMQDRVRSKDVREGKEPREVEDHEGPAGLTQERERRRSRLDERRDGHKPLARSYGSIGDSNQSRWAGQEDEREYRRYRHRSPDKTSERYEDKFRKSRESKSHMREWPKEVSSYVPSSAFKNTGGESPSDGALGFGGKQTSEADDVRYDPTIGGTGGRKSRSRLGDILDSTVKRRKDDRENRSKQPLELKPGDVPLTIPYTTATSQFLYGTNVVRAALLGRRRTFHRLYLRRPSGNDNDPTEYKPDNFDSLRKLALEAKIPVTPQTNSRLLDTLSDGRPHNGAVLEASPLACPSVLSLKKPLSTTGSIPLEIIKSPDSDQPKRELTYSHRSWRHPLVLLLDGVVDPGNVGNILRTAYFYGVDAVAVATNTCAPLTSSILAKASAGAIEALPILSLPRPSQFVYNSAKEGWRVYAAMAPEENLKKMHKQVTAAGVSAMSPLAKQPCLLMLGAEGEGLRQNLVSKADFNVCIERGSMGTGGVDIGVDSVNVAVAAGVLVDAFMRQPVPT